MALRRGFQYPRSSGHKRLTAWAGGPLEVDGSVSSSVARLWSSGIVLTGESEVTIVRIRGIVSLTVQTASAPGAGFRGAVGLGIVSLPAFTAGVASLPIPNSDPEWPGWMWHSFFDLRSITGMISDGVNAGALIAKIPVDTKAMRKFGEQQVLVGVTEVVESDTATMEIEAQTRVLLKLS